MYGEPITADGKTIIPVAQVAFGYGGGFGQKARRHQQQADTEAGPPPDERGAGGGGGMYARPRGVYEVTAQGTRFIPANNIRQLLLAGFIGFLIRSWLGHRR